MTSKERHELRYRRRKTKREEKKMHNARYYSKESIYSWQELEKAYLNCRKGVRWKATVQKFGLHLYRNIRHLSEKLYDNTWESEGFHEFDIIERGHPRHILSVNIEERCVQRSLCDNYIVPLLSRPLIYDNGATLPGKGISFSVNRYKAHLEKYIRKHGSKGYIYFFDFSSYFANIDNELLVSKALKYLPNYDLNNLYTKFIFAFGKTGLGLGSQVSQISAVFYPNDLDHYIKDVLQIKYYGRYMDDGYAIFETYEDTINFGRNLHKLCDKNHITINWSKRTCVPLTKSYTFIKQRTFVDGSIVILRVNKSVARKERKRLRKYKELLNQGRLTKNDVYLYFHSWLGYYYNKNNFYMLLNMIRYFNELFNVKYRPKKLKTRKDKVFYYMSRRALLNPKYERRHKQWKK